MQTLGEIKRLLDERGLRPKHRFGQNFLHDHHHLTHLVDAAGVDSSTLALEVGPGTGTLTETMLDRGAHVIACELDHDLAELVNDRIAMRSDDDRTRFTLIRGDCLARGRRLNTDVVEAIAGAPFRLVANLPYQAASPLMATLLLHHPECTGQFVTIQKEVGDRLLAAPGTKTWGPLGIIVQAYATVERLCVLPPGCFWPQPKVTSAMLAIHPHGDDQVVAAELRTIPREHFARFVTTLFSRRRKQLGSVLGRSWMTAHAPDIDPMRRAETLSIADLARLASFTTSGNPDAPELRILTGDDSPGL